MLILGRAGTGKSAVIVNIMKLLGSYAITGGPTGIASKGINGNTF